MCELKDKKIKQNQIDVRFVRRLVSPLLFVALLSPALVVLQACGADQPPPRPIVVRMIADLSGPNHAASAAYNAGRVDLLRELSGSAEFGGREIDFAVADTGGDPNEAFRAYLAWKGQLSWAKTVTLFGDSTKCCLDLADSIGQARMPAFSRSNDARLASPVTIQRVAHLEDGSIKIVDNPGAPYNYSAIIDSSSALRGGVDFMQKNGRNLGFVRCADDDLCAPSTELGRAYASGKYGMQVSDDLLLDVSMNDAEIRRAVSTYIADNPSLDWIYLAQGGLPVAPVLAALQGHETRLMLGVWSMKEDLASIRAARGKVFGLVVARPFGDMAGAQAMPDLVSGFHRNARDLQMANVHYVMGYATVALWSIAVQRVLDQGEEPSRENLKKALDTMTNIQTGGLLNSITFSQEDHRASLKGSIYRVDGEGSFDFVEDFEIERRKTWLGW